MLCCVHDSNLGVTAPTFRTNLVQTQQEFSFESPIQLEAAVQHLRHAMIHHTRATPAPSACHLSPTPPRLFQHANRLPVPPLVLPPPSASVCAARLDGRKSDACCWPQQRRCCRAPAAACSVPVTVAWSAIVRPPAPSSPGWGVVVWDGQRDVRQSPGSDMPKADWWPTAIVGRVARRRLMGCREEGIFANPSKP